MMCARFPLRMFVFRSLLTPWFQFLVVRYMLCYFDVAKLLVFVFFPVFDFTSVSRLLILIHVPVLPCWPFPDFFFWIVLLASFWIYTVPILLPVPNFVTLLTLFPIPIFVIKACICIQLLESASWQILMQSAVLRTRVYRLMDASGTGGGLSQENTFSLRHRWNWLISTKRVKSCFKITLICGDEIALS